MEKADEPKTETEAPRASKTLHRVGSVITGFWIVGLITYGTLNYQAFTTLAPNELGDFAAGAFAPLAFLWLVLGFFQQGEELRYSGRALWLQGEELRNSVEQQRELVKATRDQLTFDSEVLAQQREDRIRDAQPMLELRQGGNMSSAGGSVHHDFHLVNQGRPCTALKVSIDGEAGFDAQRDLLGTGADISFKRELPREEIEPFTVRVSYLDERMRPGMQSFRVSGANRFEIVPVQAS